MNLNRNHIELKSCIIIVFLLSVACSSNDDAIEQSTKDCDCNGKYAITVKDTSARLTSGRTFVIKGTESAIFKELSSCDTSKLSGLTTSPLDNYNYKVSGGLRPPCVSNGVSYIWTIDITSIDKKSK